MGMPPRISPTFAQGSYKFAMFYTHTLGEIWRIPAMHMHITFIKFAENSPVMSMLALYGSTMYIPTLKPYLEVRQGYESSSTILLERYLGKFFSV